jgi:hypothetical protein
VLRTAADFTDYCKDDSYDPSTDATSDSVERTSHCAALQLDTAASVRQRMTRAHKFTTVLNRITAFEYE